MSELRQWLNPLNLARYADAFEENDICCRTDESLQAIGVASLGQRMRICDVYATALGTLLLESYYRFHAQPAK